jgi:hypothetical protein
MAAQIGVPVDLSDAWAGLHMSHMEPVAKLEAPMYTTALGLARLERIHD